MLITKYMILILIPRPLHPESRSLNLKEETARGMVLHRFIVIDYGFDWIVRNLEGTQKIGDKILRGKSMLTDLYEWAQCEIICVLCECLPENLSQKRSLTIR